MAISFECPHCHTRHRVKDSLAGALAKCKCGQRITVPTVDGEPHETIVASCSSCFSEHEVYAELAGRKVQCSCGATFTVPGELPEQPKSSVEGLLDELTDTDKAAYAGETAEELRKKEARRKRRKSDWQVLKRYLERQ